MRTSTKIERANLALEILKQNTNTPKTLGSWLDVFNKKFKSTHTLRNTKELAHMFKYIQSSNKISHFEKKKEVKIFEKVKSNNIIYIFKMEEKIKTPKISCKNCNKEMTIVDQKHGKTEIVSLKYECKCGCTGLVLFNEEDGSFDRYVYNETGELLNYDKG